MNYDFSMNYRPPHISCQPVIYGGVGSMDGMGEKVAQRQYDVYQWLGGWKGWLALLITLFSVFSASMRALAVVVSLLLSPVAFASQNNEVSLPTPMEWYRGCTTTATSMLLDWFGQHGYLEFAGMPSYTSYPGCDTAYIRGDIANLFANNTPATDEYGRVLQNFLSCPPLPYNVSDDNFVKGITKVLQSKGQTVNDGTRSSWQVVLGGANGSFGVEDLVATIDNGIPLVFMVNSLKFNSPNDPDFNEKRNHAVLVFGYSGYDGASDNDIRVDLFSGWSSNKGSALKSIVLNRNSTDMFQQAIVVIPPNKPDARMITRTSALNRIFTRFNISTVGSDFANNRPYDVGVGTPFYSDIAYAYNHGIVSGYSADETGQRPFKPLHSVSRVEFVKMLFGALNISLDSPSYTKEPPFPDMDRTQWYYPYIKAAYNLGILQGTQSGYLMPNLKISEKEAGLILDRSAATSTSSENYFWTGNGSIISYHGQKANTNDSEYPYGIQKDITQLHPGNPVGFFQWQVTKGACDRLSISANSPNNGKRVDITVGPWNDRSRDKLFDNVSLPFVIGESNTGFTFSDGDDQWFVVSVALKDAITQSSRLNAECTSQSSSYQQSIAGKPVLLNGGYKWNGNASIISRIFSHLSGQSGQNFGGEWPYAIFQDVTKVSPSPEKPLVFFQWMASDMCTSLTIDSPDLGYSEKRVTISYKPWNSNSPDTQSGTLPMTLSNSNVVNDAWRVIQVAFESPVSKTARVTAKCPGF